MVITIHMLKIPENIYIDKTPETVFSRRTRRGSSGTSRSSWWTRRAPFGRPPEGRSRSVGRRATVGSKPPHSALFKIPKRTTVTSSRILPRAPAAANVCPTARSDSRTQVFMSTKKMKSREDVPQTTVFPRPGPKWGSDQLPPPPPSPQGIF